MHSDCIFIRLLLQGGDCSLKFIKTVVGRSIKDFDFLNESSSDAEEDRNEALAAELVHQLRETQQQHSRLARLHRVGIFVPVKNLDGTMRHDGSDLVGVDGQSKLIKVMWLRSSLKPWSSTARHIRRQYQKSVAQFHLRRDANG